MANKTVREKLDEIRGEKKKVISGPSVQEKFPGEDSIELSQGDLEEIQKNMEALEEASGKNRSPEVTTVVSSKTKKIAEELLKDLTDERSGDKPQEPPMDPIMFSIKELVGYTENLPLWGRWNLLLLLLRAAKDVWEKGIFGTPSVEIERLGSPKVKVLSIYRLAKFEVMLPRFVDYWRAYGGLEDMALDIQKDAKED